MEFLFYLAIYVYMAYTLQIIAKKTSTQKTWWAWVPVANLFLLVKIAQKSYWWVLWSLIPIVNFVITAIVWMKIAVRLDKPKWIGIIAAIPFVNFVVIGYLAFSDKHRQLDANTENRTV